MNFAKFKLKTWNVIILIAFFTTLQKLSEVHASGLEYHLNDDNIERVKETVLENCRVGIREISEIFYIS